MKTIIVEVKNKQPKTEKKGKIRVAAYCRVSTLKDEQRLDSLLSMVQKYLEIAVIK